MTASASFGETECRSNTSVIGSRIGAPESPANSLEMQSSDSESADTKSSRVLSAEAVLLTGSERSSVIRCLGKGICLPSSVQRRSPVEKGSQQKGYFLKDRP